MSDVGRISATLRALGAAVILGALAAGAEGAWRTGSEGGETRAGYAPDGGFTGLWFACRPGGAVRMVFDRNGATYDRTRRHTAVVSVDGTAFVFQAEAVFNARDRADDFVVSAPLGEWTPLIEALKRGEEAEVSLPSGRFRVALAGSGRALGALEAACAS